MPFANLASGKVWWEEIGRTTLAVAGDTISITGIPARKYLKLAICTIGSGAITQALRFNNDSANNYATRTNINGGGDVVTTSVNQLLLTSGDSNSISWVVFDVLNFTSREKLITGDLAISAVGAASASLRVEYAIKWANTTDQITRVDLVNSNTGDFAIGSEMVVLGHD